MEPSSVEKIFEVDSHIGSVAAGLIPDSRVLIDCARVEAQNHKFMFNEPIRVKAVAQAVSDLALNFGEGDINTKKKPMARPYGVALIIAGIDDSGPKLYYTDPSGTMTEFEAKGMGAADEGIQSLLEEHYKPVNLFTKDLSLHEAEKLALQCLKEVMEEKITKSNVELVTLSLHSKKYESRSEDYVANLIPELK